MGKTLVCFGLFFAFASDLTAQSFEELGGQLKVGKTVSITDAAGRQVKGKIAEVSPGSVELLVNGAGQTFNVAAVQKITQRQRNTGRGAKWGFLAGLGLGFLAVIGSSSEDCGQMCGGPALLTFAGFMAGFGAGAGAGIGALSTRERVIYSAPGAPSSSGLTISPVARRDGIGITGAVRF